MCKIGLHGLHARSPPPPQKNYLLLTCVSSVLEKESFASFLCFNFLAFHFHARTNKNVIIKLL